MGDKNPKRAAVRRAWRRRETRRERRERAWTPFEQVSRQRVRVVRSKRAMRARNRTTRARAVVETHGRRVEGTTREGERDDAWEREDD